MDIVKGIERLRKKHKGAVLTIGNFDGVHLGHQKIISAVRKEAHRLGTRSLAITFEPHPVKVLRPERGLKLLTPPEEKARLLGHYGIDSVIFIGFSRQFASTPAEDFIQHVLVEKLGAKSVVVGHNYAFGRGKGGSTELLRRMGKKAGFSTRVVRHASMGGSVVSSSRVRSLLGWGRVQEAARNLGRPFMLEGTVVKGAGRGRKVLDTPTANLTTQYETVPRHGVYAVLVTIQGHTYKGVANIGTNPTFGGTETSYEVHVLNFEGDLMGCLMRVHFIKRIRDERKFASAASLGEQIFRDIEIAAEALKKTRAP